MRKNRVDRFWTDRLIPFGSNTEDILSNEEFKEMLVRRTGIPVDFMDERLSTVEAIELMNEAGIAGKDRKEYVDKIAATFILQWYLDEKNSEGK